MSARETADAVLCTSPPDRPPPDGVLLPPEGGVCCFPLPFPLFVLAAAAAVTLAERRASAVRKSGGVDGVLAAVRVPDSGVVFVIGFS